MKNPTDFETAMEGTGFGLFNLILLMAAIPSCLATVFETSTMSYVFPSAECDLNLTLVDKGSLNAITYAGMITSAIAWGFIADTKGRKKVLVIGYLVDAICVLGSSISQNLITLMCFKYLGGFAVCGPFAVLVSYMTEFHGIKYRSRVMMAIGMLFSVATLLLPLLAWLILPNSFRASLFNGFLVIHSWNLFLVICAIPSLTSGLIFIFLPESPKFLMSRGRNQEALDVLSTIYAVNFRKSKKTYPFSSLVEETSQKEDKQQEDKQQEDEQQEKQNVSEGNGSLHFLRKGVKQLKPLFCKPYLKYSVIVYAIQFCVLLGLNTIRLWLPQLFNSIEEFKLVKSESNSLCDAIQYSVNKTLTANSEYSPECSVVISDTTFVNTIVVGVTGLIGYFVAGGIINAIGSKRILLLSLTISGVCGVSLLWSTNSTTTLALSSIYVTVGSIGTTSLLGIIVNFFPTSLRTMVVSVAMMFGRSGALMGNIVFPFLMSLGCLPPFLMVGLIMLVAVLLSCTLPSK